MPTQLLGDTNTLSDALGTFSPYVTLISDTFSFSDVVVAVGRIAPTEVLIEDSIFISDSWVRISIALTTTVTAVVDSFTFSDSVSTSRTQKNSTSDTNTLSDGASVLLTLALVVSDSITFSDAATHTFDTIFQDLTAAVADSIVFLDSAAATISGSRATFTDNLFFQDSVLVVLQTTRNPYLRRYLNDAN